MDSTKVHMLMDIDTSTSRPEWENRLPKAPSIRLRRIKSSLYKWRWVLVSVGVFGMISMCMWIYRREFFQALEALSHKLTSMGSGGYILMATLIFSSSFPPIVGYSTYVTLSGYTFGFNTGFPLAYGSALCGSVTCFCLCRLWLKTRVRRLLSFYSNLEIVVKAVEKKGFKLFLLVRLSPYPFNLLNVLFAATDLSLLHFTLGTAITLIKLALHVYIGANLTSFAKHVLGEDQDMTEQEIHADKIRYISMTAGFVLAVAIMVYIYSVAKQAIKETMTAEESASFLNTYDEERDVSDMISMDRWDEWENEEETDSLSDQLINKDRKMLSTQ